MDREETKDKCIWYQWGGDYPSSMGARCNSHQEFFYREDDGKLSPSCTNCEFYEEEKKSNPLYEAIKALNDFLEKHPEMKKKQKEIEDILNSVAEEDRLPTIMFLMSLSVRELTEELRKIAVH